MLLFTGALTSKPYAFTARPWELRSVQSIDVSDGVGSNIRVDFKETEIMRILPRRNVDINESWISDKARFFYDGLKRQRLNSPYMKVNGELRKVKWSKLFKNLVSVLRVYSYEYGSSKIGFILGSACDTETFYSVRDFSLSFGFYNGGIDHEFKINLDNPGNYYYRGEFKDLEKVDFALFVGTNPRFEASTVNLRLRKVFRRGDLKIASIGGSFSSTFPVQFLGLTTKTLLEFVEGKHPICKLFARAKSPVLIYGSSILKRVDAYCLNNLFKSLHFSFKSVFLTTVPVCTLHNYSNILGGFELGFNGFNKSSLKELKVLYAIGTENENMLQEQKGVLIVQNSHGNNKTNCADFILPSTSFIEKSSFYYNMEGRPQKTQRAFIGPNLSRDDWRIVRLLTTSLRKSVFYDTQAQLITEAARILPSLYFGNSWFQKREGSVASVCFEEKALNLKEKLYFSNFKLFLEDFYMTNNICQSSRIMAKASQYLRSYFHNYKFL